DSLVAYVRELPAPVAAAPSHSRAGEAGRSLFESIGCSACHTPRLGDIDGIYSDLLLHDMGPDLGSLGDYYGDASGSPSGSEWRTPPLWGFRDSAPYLHDGRAPSLEEAVEFHGGQADDSAARFSQLPPTEKSQILRFLDSLTAQPPVAGEDEAGPNV